MLAAAFHSALFTLNSPLKWFAPCANATELWYLL